MLERKKLEAELEAVGGYEQYLQRSDTWEPGKSNPMLDVHEGRISGGKK